MFQEKVAEGLAFRMLFTIVRLWQFMTILHRARFAQQERNLCLRMKVSTTDTMRICFAFWRSDAGSGLERRLQLRRAKVDISVFEKCARRAQHQILVATAFDEITLRSVFVSMTLAVVRAWRWFVTLSSEWSRQRERNLVLYTRACNTNHARIIFSLWRVEARNSVKRRCDGKQAAYIEQVLSKVERCVHASAIIHIWHCLTTLSRERSCQHERSLSLRAKVSNTDDLRIIFSIWRIEARRAAKIRLADQQAACIEQALFEAERSAMARRANFTWRRQSVDVSSGQSISMVRNRVDSLNLAVVCMSVRMRAESSNFMRASLLLWRLESRRRAEARRAELEAARFLRDGAEADRAAGGDGGLRQIGPASVVPVVRAAPTLSSKACGKALSRKSLSFCDRASSGVHAGAIVMRRLAANLARAAIIRCLHCWASHTFARSLLRRCSQSGFDLYAKRVRLRQEKAVRNLASLCLNAWGGLCRRRPEERLRGELASVGAQRQLQVPASATAREPDLAAARASAPAPARPPREHVQSSATNYFAISEGRRAAFADVAAPAMAPAAAFELAVAQGSSMLPFVLE